MATIENFHKFMDLMWQDYIQINPQAYNIFKVFSQSGESLVNDHIALRTFNHPSFGGIKALSQHFLNYGYIESENEYFFTEKKLYAKHFEHPNGLPKIFISELEVEKTSNFVQQTIEQIAEQLPLDVFKNQNVIYSGRHWKADYKTYTKLAEESEYASWVYAYGFRPNHFTVSINHLKNFQDIYKLNDFLKSHNFTLNTSGGEVKGTPAELLEQSSTMANKIKVSFSEGEFEIPGCYYEFAKRYSLPNGKLYQGFIAKSADKIFESTNKT
jgi:Domain of unknown function (DUF1338)